MCNLITQNEINKLRVYNSVGWKCMSAINFFISRLISTYNKKITQNEWDEVTCIEEKKRNENEQNYLKWVNCIDEISDTLIA